MSAAAVASAESPPCWSDTSIHEAAKRHPRMWEMLVENVRPWPSADLEMGECKLCRSTITRRAPGEVGDHA